MKLHQQDYVPDHLLEAEAPQLAGLLRGPTLVHLAGRRPQPLFVSVLTHGNETTGWDAVRVLLRRYRQGPGVFALPRALSLFIANVDAAALGLRHLDGQPDYNRVWPGSEYPETPEHRLMQQVVDVMAERQVFASVDVHNNTGLNPHYACINVIDNRFLHLAAMFSRTLVYFLRPRGVQSMAMARLCPAVTLECGKVGQSRGAEHALEYLEACLHLSEHPTHPVAAHDVDLFHTVATVKVSPGVSFGFGSNGVDLELAPDIDRLNFRELPSGTSLGRVHSDGGLGIEARDEGGSDRTERFFYLEGGEIKVRLPVMPSMLTTDQRVARQDCLCYLMERFDAHLPASG
jgi:succinylglutamate desuccinylase